MIENTLQLLGEPVSPLWQGETIEAFGSTDVGMVRDSNQDSFLIRKEEGIFLVADGMGGRAGGEVASSLAVETIGHEVHQKLETILSSEVASRRALLARTINAASLKIYERSLELPQYRGMGTTTTFLWITPSEHRTRARSPMTAVVAHVGDSRCYLFRSGFLYQVTDDHSLVNEQVKSGLLRQGEASTSQMKNVITRCVGYQEEEEVDTFALPLYRGDRFLLCSDGLTGKVNDEEIAEWLRSSKLSEIPDDLIRLANQRGGEDNITAVVVEVH
jgi:serine/threonine protein phosphatase PrpC